MEETLTQDVAIKLNLMLEEYGQALKEPASSTVYKYFFPLYQRVWDCVCVYTNDFLMATVYSVEGVVPPV